MGAMFRSEKMSLVQLFIQIEAAYTTISELGELGLVQFRDLNEDVSLFQRKFANEVKRCDEMERQIKYIETELEKEGNKIPDTIDIPKAPLPKEMNDLEARLEKTEHDIKEMAENGANLRTSLMELNELRYVLTKTDPFFAQQENNIPAPAAEDTQAISTRGELGFVAGVISMEKFAPFERMLWRISRGNVYLKWDEIEEPLKDPRSGMDVKKVVFVAFCQGEQLRSRVKKVCTGFHATLYNCPSGYNARQELVKGVNTRLEDLKQIIGRTDDHRQMVLVNVLKDMSKWSIMVIKMKAIYYTLNMLNVDVTQKCLIGECWLGTADVPLLKTCLLDCSNASGSTLASFMNEIEHPTEAPPTFNRTNKFTRGFQNLIEAYGISSYREVNPALYTIITFPFLFAVMFGDIGHATIMLAFGLFLVVREKQLIAARIKDEVFQIFFGGRYIILLMGIFSVYTGFIYNDMFARSLQIFGSSWSEGLSNGVYNLSTLVDNEELQFKPSDHYKNEPYFFGMDPVWQLAENKIIFQNSYKMKLSIIFGVLHMIFGVCMSVVNSVYFRKYENIVLEFVPQVIFLICLFAWMVVMMFLKWVFYDDFNAKLDIEYGTACAPSVLILFINMMLLTSSDPADEKCPSAYLFDGQEGMQTILVVVAVICIPVMLLGKPLFILFKRKIMGKKHPGEVKPKKPSAGHDYDDEPMSEVFIYQAIHTIEYVLSTISHTASYLRLWALSLAHAQLAEVLWDMVFQMFLVMSEDGNYVASIFIYVGFAAWAVITLAILVLMEGLSAFLHTLRLHWVEFMSKFYFGLGYPFEPFSFNDIINKLEMEDVN